MTDLALPSVRTLDLASDAAKARVRARYRAEARFKFYGLAAIGLTAIFLVVVLTDIVARGLPAFWQHKLLLDVTVDRTEIDRPPFAPAISRPWCATRCGRNSRM
jgi:phosphate transport system permease protein